MAKDLASGELSDGTNLEQKDDLENHRQMLTQVLGSTAEITYIIAAGVVTPTIGIFAVDTEGLTPTDDLDRIATVQTQTDPGLPDGTICIVRSVDPARVVTLKHAATGDGEMIFADAVDFVLDAPEKWAMFHQRAGDWFEIDRSWGADSAGFKTALGLKSIADVPNPADPGDDNKILGALAGKWIIITNQSTGSGGPAER